jgi:hypothetical protein
MTDPTHLYHFCTLTPHASHSNYKSGSVESSVKARTIEDHDELVGGIADVIKQEKGSFVVLSLSYLGQQVTTEASEYD